MLQGACVIRRSTSTSNSAPSRTIVLLQNGTASARCAAHASQLHHFFAHPRHHFFAHPRHHFFAHPRHHVFAHPRHHFFAHIGIISSPTEASFNSCTLAQIWHDQFHNYASDRQRCDYRRLGIASKLLLPTLRPPRSILKVQGSTRQQFSFL